MPRIHNLHRAGWFTAGLLSGVATLAAFGAWAANSLADEEAHR